MNAIDLHALYDTVWNTIPDTQPKNGVKWLVLYCNEWAWMECESDFGPDNAEPVSDYVAASLCRTALEDWLVSDGGSSIEICRSVEALFVRVNRPGGIHQYFDEGPTVHHALVSAALAVYELKQESTP